MTLTAAYAKAYPPRHGERGQQTEWSNASRLRRQPHVAHAIDEARARAADEKAIRDPEATRREALIALRRIRQGRLDAERAPAIRAELRSAERALRQRARSSRPSLQECRREAWRTFFRASQAVWNAKRGSLSQAEKIEIIFRHYAPPIAPPDLLTSPLSFAEPDPCLVELVEHVRVCQQTFDAQRA